MSKLRIKEVLKSKGMLSKDFAEILNIDAKMLSNQINGNPTKKTLEKWAKLLDVEVRDLFAYDKSKEPIHLIINQELKSFKTFDELKEFVNS